MERRGIIDELHRPARRNFERRNVLVFGIDDLWQADLVDMKSFSRENKEVNYILIVIDVFSKYAFPEPVKTKSGENVSKAFEKILKRNNFPKNLQTDDEKEFFNSIFQNLMTKYKINHYSTYSVMKASVVERFNRTLKMKMWKKFSFFGHHKFLNILPELLREYNDTNHRTINMKPKDVNKSNEKKLLSTVYDYENKKCKAKFKIGDKVRISKHKHLFERGYEANWTGEIFTIDKIKNSCPVTYILKDYRGERLLGSFYEHELQKSRFPDVFLVEKVLKKRKNKIFVKWLGFDSTHNSWVNEKDYV